MINREMQNERGERDLEDYFLLSSLIRAFLPASSRR
jgi:hypothetical protein